MKWRGKRKTKLVSVLLILVLLMANSLSSIMADEFTIPVSELSEEAETKEQEIVLANSISGVLWFDENNDGILDEGEEAISDYSVYLYSEDDLTGEIQKVTTNQEGKYEFSELEPGKYVVGIKAEENETEYLLPTAEVKDDTTNKFTVDAELLAVAYSAIIAIAEESIVNDISCGMGQNETGDADSNNAINDNANVNEETNDEDEAESNDNDSINNEDDQETEQEDNIEDNELRNEDSADEEMNYDQSLDYSISPSDLETDTNVDTTDTNSISGLLWLDKNTDGIYDVGEQTVSDYPVYLYKAEDTSTVIETVATDGDGKYKFSNLEPDDYKVGIKMMGNGTNYLLPLCGVTDDNKFVIDWESLEGAFTDTITLELDDLAIDINGGLRTTPEVSPVDATGGYVVRETTATGLVLGTYDTLPDACSAINLNSTYSTFYIMVQKDDASVALATIDSNKTVYLRSQTTSSIYTLTKTDNQRHILNNGTLYLEYITLDGGSVGGGIQVNSAGSFIMSTDATIQNCSNISGGAVYLCGRMEMNAGTICNNKGGGGIYGPSNYVASFDMSGGTISNNSTNGAGGGICWTSSGTINLTGGEISYNISAFQGGGIDLQRGNIIIDGATISNNEGTWGGGVSAGSYGTSTCDFLSGTITENTATIAGGGISVNGTLNMAGSGQSNLAIISNNNAEYGGGVYLITDSEFNMTTTYSYIRANSATSVGGGVSVCGAFSHSGATFNMEAGTIGGSGYENRASYGGGVYVSQGTFTMGGTSACYINYNIASKNGGGMYVKGSSSVVDMTTTSCYIRCNSATLNGGGIYLDSGTVNMQAGSIGYGTGFTNKAVNGGGVYVYGGTFSMTGTSCRICNNEATSDGGGVYVAGGAFDMQAGTIGYSGFGNTAANGGGVYASGGTFTMGSGTTCNIYFNTASVNGGGVYVSGSGTEFIMTNSNCQIRSNEATSDGGGVYLANGTFNMQAGSIGYTSNTYKNTATNGGGVYAARGTFDMSGTGSCYIRYNTASNAGGGVYVGSAKLNMTSASSYVIKNTATLGNGGGVYLETSGSITTTGGSIISNTATSGDGGGIYTANTSSYSNIKTDSSTVFSGNKAQGYCNPPTNAATDFLDIGFSSISLTLAAIESLHPLNNYDVNCETIKLTYDSNATYGGQGTAYYEYYVKDADVTILDNTDSNLEFTNSKHDFDGWNDATDGGGTSYTVGTDYTFSADTTIYAQWRRSTGSITVEKYGEDDNDPLPGAAFKIEMWDSTLNSGSGDWKHISYDSSSGKWYDTSDSTGTYDSNYTQTTALEASIASAKFENLDLGEYRITEVSSPDKYIVLINPIVATIPTSGVYDITYTIYDSEVLDMPEAGGLTQVMFIMIGLAVTTVTAGVFIYIRSRKIRNRRRRR